MAVGLGVSGLGQYAALTLAARALGAQIDAVFAAFWSLLAVCGPGLFAPLEQALARAVAARRALGQGAQPLLIRCAILGGGALLAMAIISAALAGVIANILFNGDAVIVVIFVAGLATYAGYFLVRGTTAGTGAFGRYGLLLAAEGVLRVGFIAVLVIAGSRSAPAFSLAVVAGSLGATILVGVLSSRLLQAGPSAAWSELTRALAYLTAASLVLQFLASVGTVAVKVLAAQGEQTAAARFLSSRIIAFIPLFIFPAVVAPLLPRLSAHAARSEFAIFRRVWLQHVRFAAAVGALTITGAAALGPLASRILFGPSYDLTSLDFALLGVAATGLMLSQVSGAALVALRGFAASALSWLAGAAGFFLVIAVIGGLFLRVELALVAGAWLATAGMTILALRRTAVG